MILSAHQPAYLPWLGYFDKIAKSDIFVFLDCVQFEKNSYINRNQIKTSQGVQWLTMPVLTKGHLGKTIFDMRVDEGVSWRRKHLASVLHNYKTAPFFDYGYQRLERLLSMQMGNLGAICWHHLEFWLREFDIKTRVVRQSELMIGGKKSDLILNMCVHHQASVYLSGSMGRGYLNISRFQECGVDVKFQDYSPVRYPQLWGGFVPRLSVLDYWMNCGPGKLLDKDVEHVIQQ